MTPIAAALFVRKDSIYNTIRGVECYDYDRDAMQYAGPAPVIAHPPCGAWGRFRRHVERASGRRAEEERAAGIFCAAAVRQFGGVLEQPACSELWTAANLPLHGYDANGGYTLQICQSWFGHQAEKCTWLYISNGNQRLPPFEYDFRVPRKGLLQLGRREREATPLNLALWLFAIAAGPAQLACTAEWNGRAREWPLEAMAGQVEWPAGAMAAQLEWP